MDNVWKKKKKNPQHSIMCHSVAGFVKQSLISILLG